jgi:hypothetical protein
MDDAGSKDELLLILIWLADVNQELEVWHTPAAALRPSWTVKLRHRAPAPARGPPAPLTFAIACLHSVLACCAKPTVLPTSGLTSPVQCTLARIWGWVHVFRTMHAG